MASVGLYAVIAHATASRTQEIGVRMALGANARNILLLVMRRGLWQIASGLVLGVAAAFPVTRIMTSLPEPRDIFRHTLSQCMSSNPDSIRWVVALMVLYLHVGPFSREVIAKLETMIAALEPAAEPLVRIERASVV